MTIDEIYTQAEDLAAHMYDKAETARETAKRAHKKGDYKKRDKFNAVARVYEMMFSRVAAVRDALDEHTSKEFRNERDIPF